MRVLIASDKDVKNSIVNAKHDKAMKWKVPKTARAGDLCALSHWSKGLYALAELLEEPRAEKGKVGVYLGNIGNIKVLDVAILHEILVKRIPGWKWATYPKKYTTVPMEFEADLLKLMSVRNRAPGEVDYSSEEGAAKFRHHIVRERDTGLSDRKKAAVLAKTGALKCQACGFDFSECYGKVGEGFCEVHHLDPLSMRRGNSSTARKDLAVVCSNCHRIPHRRGLLTMPELVSTLSRKSPGVRVARSL
jgi:5-methylcytosine-specific restriction endonuclease McrA